MLSFAAPVAAVHLPPPAPPILIERGKQAIAKGDWEKAADDFADALFQDEHSTEARKLLREAAVKVIEERTDRIQRERMAILTNLGLLPEELPPGVMPAVKPPPPLKFGPPTPDKPVVRAVKRRIYKPEVVKPAAKAEPEVRVPTAADREMARFLYFQGLKAYAENELEEAKQSLRKALEFDPDMARAKGALERLEKRGHSDSGVQP